MAAGNHVGFGQPPSAGATGMGEKEGVFGRGDVHAVGDASDVLAAVDLDGEESRGKRFSSSEEEEYIMPTPMENGNEGACSGEGAGPSSTPENSTLAVPLTTAGDSDGGNRWDFEVSGFAALDGMRPEGSELRCHQDSSSPTSNSCGGGSQYHAFNGESMASTSTSPISNSGASSSSSSSSAVSASQPSTPLRNYVCGEQCSCQ